jgi:ribonuclease P protein component
MSTAKKLQIKRLKGRTSIDRLFDDGQIAQTKTLVLKFVKNPLSDTYFSGVSVPKKCFKKAVDRNRIKRQLRVAIREQKKSSLFPGTGMLLFKGKKIPDTEFLKEQIQALFESVANK